MGLSRKLNRCAAWIACLAILLAALAPSISHAIAAKRASIAAQHEICATAETAETAATDHAGHAQGYEAPAEHTVHTEHCPFCLTNAFSFALPPATFDFALPAGTQLIPALFHASSRPLFAWTPAQARAPPRR